MLGKLLKYEFKSTARLFLPFYGVLILLGILNRVLFVNLDNIEFLFIPRTITMGLYIFLIIATFIMTYLIIIQRYYKNLLGEEGYLSMTLPVKTSSHIISKGISAFVWLVSTLLVTLLSILINISDYSFIPRFFDLYKEAVVMFKAYSGMSLNLFVILGLAISLVYLSTSILMIYTAAAFGQLVNKRRGLASFGAYAAIYAILQFISVIVFNLITVFGIASPFDENFGSNIPFSSIANIFYIVLALQIIFSASFFFTTKYLLKNKLNLE